MGMALLSVVLYERKPLQHGFSVRIQEYVVIYGWITEFSMLKYWYQRGCFFVFVGTVYFTVERVLLKSCVVQFGTIMTLV